MKPDLKPVKTPEKPRFTKGGKAGPGRPKRGSDIAMDILQRQAQVNVHNAVMNGDIHASIELLKYLDSKETS